MFEREDDGGVSPVEAAGAAAEVHEAVLDDRLCAAGLGPRQGRQHAVALGTCRLRPFGYPLKTSSLGTIRTGDKNKLISDYTGLVVWSRQSCS